MERLMGDQRRRYGSAREWVYHELRARILSGELAGGEQLRSKPLTELYGVSVSPLREAIHQLAANGFVELSPQRGARVTSISIADVAALYDTRSLLEPEAARRSVAATDSEHAAAVHAALVEVSASQPADFDGRAATAAAEEAFFAAVCERCTNRWLLDTLEALRSHTARARAVLAAQLHIDADPAAMTAVADAVAAGAADEAARLVSELLATRARAVEPVAAS
jgi:DNA-binding GntR family transcriptional regulator